MNVFNLFDHFEQKIKYPYQTSFNKIYKKLFLFSKSCHTMNALLRIWLHLQALSQSTFGLVSVFVFSVQNVLGPTVIWLIFVTYVTIFNQN